VKVSQRVFAVGAALTVGAVVAALASPPAVAGTTTTPQVAAVSDASSLAASGAAALVASRPAFLHASAGDQFVQQKVISSAGMNYVPYSRTYKGLPVIGGDFVIATNSAGQVVANSVAQDRAIGNLAISPKLTSAQAVAAASKQLKSVSSVESTTLVVYALGSSARLAWESTIRGTSAEGVSRLSVYVDALTGKVLNTREHVMNGTGNGGWEGSVTISTRSSGGTFTMSDPTLTNMPCQNASGNTTFSGSDDVWGDGNPATRETGCVDAFYGAQQEKAMLSSWLGRNGMDGAGGAWPIRVGLADLNAFYDGTQVQIGHNQNNQWIGSTDVIAHEMGHGIDDHTPGGISGSGTQEFVADTYGASTEWFANNPADPRDFLVGEEVNLVGSGPIRNMYNPSLLGDPNCYSSSIPTTEVHAAAGPGNHWFYLLAEGTNPTNGQPTSPTCNSTTVTGIGVQKAITIMYNAMLLKTTGSSYLKYRTWTLTAAKNLYAPSCTEFNTVKAAWNAVSVPAQTGDPTCTTSSTLTLNNPGNRTGTVGVATSLTLTATGGTTPYSFSATGLPTGLSINSSTGVISGTPSVAGTFTVNASVTDSASHSASTSFQWVISTAGSCPSPGQKIVNPGFESGTAPWSATAGVLGNTSGQTAHSGTQYAWLDGYGTTHTDTLAQSVTLPAGCTTYTLTFWLHIDSAETTTSTQYDKLTVKMGSTTIATYSNLNKASGYSQKSFNVSGFAGQTVSLNFTGTEDFSLQTSFVLDDFALNVS
jgi:Zn-dependent metalloprotease